MAVECCAARPRPRMYALAGEGPKLLNFTWRLCHTRPTPGPGLEARLFDGEQRSGLISHLEEVCGLRGGAFGVAHDEPGLVG